MDQVRHRRLLSLPEWNLITIKRANQYHRLQLGQYAKGARYDSQLASVTALVNIDCLIGACTPHGQHGGWARAFVKKTRIGIRHRCVSLIRPF